MDRTDLEHARHRVEAEQIAADPMDILQAEVRRASHVHHKSLYQPDGRHACSVILTGDRVTIPEVTGRPMIHDTIPNRGRVLTIGTGFVLHLTTTQLEYLRDALS